MKLMKRGLCKNPTIHIITAPNVSLLYNSVRI